MPPPFDPFPVVNIISPVKANPKSSELLPYSIGRFDATAIDNTALAYWKKARDSLDPVIIDLQNVTYLEHECLVHIGAIIAASQREGRRILLHLPMKDGKPTELVEFLRAWQFPEFLSDITGRPFEENLTAETADYWPTLSSHKKYVPVTASPWGKDVELLPADCFWLTPITSLTKPSIAAKDARSRFLRANLKTVLQRVLGDRGEDDRRARKVASQIVFEAVLNASMHPSATVAYTTSQLRLPRVEDKNASKAGTLEISIWDNGESISSTLQKALAEGNEITTDFFSDIRDETFIVQPLYGDNREPIRLTHQTDPKKYRDNSAVMTVLAFLAGVSSQVGAYRSIDDIQLEPEDPAITTEMRLKGGIGLRAIRRTAIDQFGGTIRYYSGRYRFVMTIMPGEADTYRVTVRHKENSWSAIGNHMQISIPLVRPRSDS